MIVALVFDIIVFIFCLYACIMVFIDLKKCRSFVNKIKAFTAVGSLVVVLKFSKNLFAIIVAFLLCWAILVDRNKKGKMSIFIGNILSYLTWGWFIFYLKDNDFRPLIFIILIISLIVMSVFAGYIGETVTDKIKKWTGQKSTSQILQK